MKKIIVFFTIMLCVVSAQAQKEAYNWHFGGNGSNSGVGLTWKTTQTLTNAGAIAGTGAVQGTTLYNFPTFTYSSIKTWEGCFAMSNPATGDLLFYSDGTTVWDSRGIAMSNASKAASTGLTGDSDSTQAGIVLPYPGSATKYIAVTLNSMMASPKFTYSVIDMTLNAPYGNVSGTKNVSFGVSGMNVSEQVTAVKVPGQEQYWIITPGKEYNNEGLASTGKMLAYKVTSSGVSTTPVVTNIGAAPYYIPLAGTPASANTGYLRMSRDAKHFAMCFGTHLIYGDFDPNSGSFSNVKSYTGYGTGPAGDSDSTHALRIYGCEFSPDNKVLYVQRQYADINTQIGKLYAYDTASLYSSSSIDAMPAGKKAIYDINSMKWTAIQAAVDGRLYMVRDNGDSVIVISDPNNMFSPKIYNSGTGFYFTYPAKSGIGLPTFNPGFLSCPAGDVAPTLSSATASPCIGSTINLNSYVTSALPANSSVQWKDATGTLVATPTAVNVSGITAQVYTVSYNGGVCFSPEATLTVTGTNCACYKNGVTVGDAEPIKTIISTLDRTAVPRNWSDPRVGSLILESKTRGMVLTRIANPQTAILDPVKGMILFDTTANVLEFYNGTIWKILEQGCPDN